MGFIALTIQQKKGSALKDYAEIYVDSADVDHDGSVNDSTEKGVPCSQRF